MKTLVFLLAIILTVVTFSLNATSTAKSEKLQADAPVQKLSGFKKDISSAD